MSQSTAAQKKNILVVVSIMSQFPELFRLVMQLKQSDSFNPVVYFNLGSYGSQSNLNKCLENDIEVVDYYCGYFEGKKKRLNSIYNIHQVVNAHRLGMFFRFKLFLKSKVPTVFNVLKECYHFTRRVNFFNFFYRMGAKIKRLQKEKSLLEKHDIELMIFAEDNEDYFTPQLIKLGHQMSIKSIVFPYTFANRYEFLEEAFVNDRRVNKNIFNFIAGRLFPKYTHEYKGKKLIRSYPSYIFSSAIFRTSAPDPWVMSSGHADVIAVESSFMKEYYEKAGIPNEKMVETGSPSLDYLHKIYFGKANYKEELALRFGLDKNKPWVLCALPPYQRSVHFKFQSYNHFIEHFIGSFAKFDGVEMIFKFHPRFDTLEIQKLCEKFGVKYISEDTLNLIGVSDLYVATVSSTIRWALALGIPTVNFDVYNYNYGDFDSAKNYHIVNSMEDFNKVFAEIYQNLMISKIETRHPLQTSFAVLDGNSHRRILELCSKLTVRHGTV